MASTNSIIVPLDVPTISEAIALIELLPQVTFWKVGLQLFTSAGPEIIHLLKDRNKRVFLDLKLHDIPNTMAEAVKVAVDYDIDFLTVHAIAGQRALQACVAAVGDSTLQLLAITVLTSLTSREVALELKIPLELPEYVLNLAMLAKEAGIPGIVCSPREATDIRRVCGHEFTIICPGVRPTWSANKDQRRVMTPRDAIAAGADYLVIGRPITQAENPSTAWEQIYTELA